MSHTHPLPPQETFWYLQISLAQSLRRLLLSPLGPSAHQTLCAPFKSGIPVVKLHWPSEPYSPGIPPPIARPPQAGEPDVGFRTFTAVGEPLWYNHFLVCGLPTRHVGSLGGSVVKKKKNLPAVQETWVWSLDHEDPLRREKKMAAHSSILAWRALWTEEPSGLQSMESQRVGHDWATNSFTFYLAYMGLKFITIASLLPSHCDFFVFGCRVWFLVGSSILFYFCHWLFRR